QYRNASRGEQPVGGVVGAALGRVERGEPGDGGGVEAGGEAFLGNCGTRPNVELVTRRHCCASARRAQRQPESRHACPSVNGEREIAPCVGGWREVTKAKAVVRLVCKTYRNTCCVGAR